MAQDMAALEKTVQKGLTGIVYTEVQTDPVIGQQNQFLQGIYGSDLLHGFLKEPVLAGWPHPNHDEGVPAIASLIAQ